jgi:hypothetical protein
VYHGAFNNLFWCTLHGDNIMAVDVCQSSMDVGSVRSNTRATLVPHVRDYNTPIARVADEPTWTAHHPG